MNTVTFLLLFALQQSPAPPPRRAAVSPTTVDVRVVDRTGAPAPGARVSAIGPSVRDGVADANGVVTFKTVTPGPYRLRAEGDGLVTLEKEIMVRAGGSVGVEMTLSVAPAPEVPPRPAEPPPPPPPPVAPPVGSRGAPRALSIPDLAEDSLGGRDNVKVVTVGCTGDTHARLIVLRDTLPAAAYPDADETLYLVAGEAVVTIDSKARTFTPGWLALLPRETAFGVARKGRNPAILLSLLTGRPCEPAEGQP